MIHKIIDWSLDNRFIVMLLALVILGLGAFAATTIPLDAVPDLTNVQVQILTNSPALGPVEVEQFITFPVENAMSGIPRVDEIRSISRFGLSAVTVAFEDGTDIYWARNLINERLLQARENIPPGMGTPELGPIATGMSEIYQFEVRAEPGAGQSLSDLRTILDWQIAFQLRSVPGVIEVNTFGGELKTYEVQVDPDKLQNYGISLSQVFTALEENNGNSGGGYIAHGSEQRLIRGEGLVGSLDDIRMIVLDSRGGIPIRVADIGKVGFAPMLRQGAVTRDGDREAVIGMVMMLMGGNSRQVVADVKAKIAEIQKTLPKGVTIDTFYDRTELVEKTIHTVAENIGVGVLLVVLMLFLLLGDVRAGLIVAAAIPLSAMCALIAMRYAGVSANLMSLGAVDFGVIVDGAVVMIENCVRRATRFQRDNGGDHVPEGVFRESAKEVAKPILFAGLIVIIVFIPILSLQGMEGKMFRPMAFTFMTALTSALGTVRHRDACDGLAVSCPTCQGARNVFGAMDQAGLSAHAELCHAASPIHDSEQPCRVCGQRVPGDRVRCRVRAEAGRRRSRHSGYPVAQRLVGNIDRNDASDGTLLVEVSPSRNGGLQDRTARNRQRSNGCLSDRHFREAASACGVARGIHQAAVDRCDAGCVGEGGSRQRLQFHAAD